MPLPSASIRGHNHSCGASCDHEASGSRLQHRGACDVKPLARLLACFHTRAGAPSVCVVPAVCKFYESPVCVAAAGTFWNPFSTIELYTCFQGGSATRTRNPNPAPQPSKLEASNFKHRPRRQVSRAIYRRHRLSQGNRSETQLVSLVRLGQVSCPGQVERVSVRVLRKGHTLPVEAPGKLDLRTRAQVPVE